LRIYYSSTPKNLPPQKEFVSDFITPLNSFESDVLGITSVDPNWQI
jgi:hypothetical protein